MPDENDVTKKLVIYGGIALLAGATGILIWEALNGGGEEERPPIIVQSGTVEFRAEYPDSKHNDTGEWEQIGSSGKWRIKHDFLSGPNDMKNGVYNGSCTGNAWRKGPLKITYTDGTTSWTVGVHVTGNYLQVDPQSGQPVTKDATDKSHLTVGDPLVKTWITSVEPQGGGSDRCTFLQTSQPVVRIEQKR